MILICAIALSNISYSQIEIEKYDEFKLAAFDQSLGLFSNVSSTGGPRFFIQVVSGFDATEFYFPNRDMFNNFVSAVEKSIPIYEKWSEITKNNSVHFIAMNMGIKEIEAYLFFICNGRHYRTHSIKMNPMFYVDKDGKCYMVIETTMIAHEKWIPFDDYSLFGYDAIFDRNEIVANADARCRLVFSSAEEISDLLAKLKEMLRLSDDNQMQSKLFK